MLPGLIANDGAGAGAGAGVFDTGIGEAGLVPGGSWSTDGRRCVAAVLDDVADVLREVAVVPPSLAVVLAV